MTIRVLRPGGSSGFIICQEEAHGCAIVDMGVQPGGSFVTELQGCCMSTESITCLALTHLHGDHVDADGLRFLLHATACRFIVPRLCWEHRPANDKELTAAYLELARSDRLLLVEGRSGMAAGNMRVCWVPTTHSVDERTVFGGNLAYRIAGVVVSGDGPVRDLFSAANGSFLMPDDDAPVRTLAVNLAHLDPDDLNAQDSFTEVRKERYRKEHGMLVELLAAMRDPQYRQFFQTLERLIPTHVRRQPLEASRELFQTMIADARDRLRFHFTVGYE
jgi:hypothetical protein